MYKYPPGEIIWSGYYNADGKLRYITTSKQDRFHYFLYELIDDKFVKLGKAYSPKVLEEKYVRI